ncbi:MAG: peptidyl-prolyl cis-trans isomerase [Myxococcales bacterium]|nr:peptidyl-prolyl cis-trans isomerase [Myxococcales bacterium]
MSPGVLLALLLLAWPLAPDTPDDHVVARATGPDGAPITITAERLRAYAAGREGEDPRKLVQDLVDFELLAGAAARAGYADDPVVKEATRPALVLRYLSLDFEPTWVAETLPEDLVRTSYERNKGFFVRPPLRRADHIIVNEGRGQRSESPALDAAAATLAERIYRDLKANPPADAEAFRARADTYEGWATKVGLHARAEALGLFARKGRYDQKFTAQVFEVEEPGTIMAPFDTPYGHHVVRVDAVEPARNVTFEEAQAELRPKIVGEVRTLKLRELTDRLARTYRAVLNPEPLEQLAERRGLDEGP